MLKMADCYVNGNSVSDINTDVSSRLNSNTNLVNNEAVEEDSTTSRCGCFMNMFKYLKRKIFRRSSLTKRVKLNESDNSAYADQQANAIVNDVASSSNTLTPNSLESNEVESVRPCARNRKNRTKKKSQNEVDVKRIKTPPEISQNPHLKKYWIKRYSLFSKYDQGIKLDEESWYSVTPEKISKEIARRCQCDVIIDAFCGAGGNTIQFAFTCERAIDIDPEKIKLAKHNATIYGVADRIEFIVADFFKIAPSLKADVVFLSPPWGGPTYLSLSDFPFSKIMEPYGGKHLYNVARQISEHIAYYLPRNIDLTEIADLKVPYAKVDRNYLDKRLIAITVYFGDLVEDYGDDWYE